MARESGISSRLRPEQERRLARKAKRMGRPASELGSLYIEEGLRRDDFAFLDLRDSSAGRQAYIQGSTLAVWEIVWIARGHGDDIQATAEHLQMAPMKVQAALNYAREFQEEIEEAIREQEAMDLEALRKLVPQVEEFPSR